MPKSTFRHPLIALLVLVSMLLQGTWALAGTTGALTGLVVLAETNAPIAGAKVTVASPSQTATATTDAQGHFAFVSLAPDTYSVSVEKQGYQLVSQTGVVVFADNTQTVTIPLLKVIGKVTTRAASALVKPGTTADVYSVDAATASKAVALGGGGALDQAYSAVASVPGVFVPAGANGWNQTILIRGGDYDQIGYEFDGVPVNRSFDNYPASTASALGQQELQVYTGSSPANAESTGLAGFINQVVKSGTYPGFADADLGVGSPQFYHKASFEIGGANPSRNFSYYLGFGGYNEDFRVIDQNNGAGLTNQYGTPFDILGCPATPSASYDSCYAITQNGTAPFGSEVGPGGGFLMSGPQVGYPVAHIQDRENVVNLHFGIPHKKDGGKDDVQLLYSVSGLNTWFYDAPSDWGNQAFYTTADASGAARGGSLPTFPGPTYVYNGPLGTAVPTNPAQFVATYTYPTQDAVSCATLSPSQTGTNCIPFNRRGASQNNQAIVKLQYQHNIGSSAYFRIYGYSFYSDWLLNDPNTYNGFGFGDSPDYELLTHSRGLSGSYVDQINSKNLLSLQASVTAASVVRANNTTVGRGGQTFALAVDSTNPNSGVCYNISGATPTATGCEPGDGASGLKTSKFIGSAPFPSTNISGLTCGSGPCEYLTTDSGYHVTLNTVKPTFSAFSITDQFKPTDKLLLNLGLRDENYQFKGADTTGGAIPFWFTAWNKTFCVAPGPGNQPFDKTQGTALYPAVGVNSACPNGTQPATMYNNPANYSFNELEPRVGGTYTLNPDDVLRFSYGRYSQPADSAAEQYVSKQQNIPFFFGDVFSMYKAGYNQPGHDIPPEVSNNYDFSWEHQVKGSDLSWKVTPFYRYTQGEQTAFFLDPKTGFVSNIPVGNLTAKGVELSIRKGNFNRNGWAGQFSYTYTYTSIKYTPNNVGGTPLDPINNDVKTYNAYTSFCSTHATDSRCGTTTTGVAAAACYTPAGLPDPTCASTSIANPYWNAPVQNLFDRFGPYFPTDTVVSTFGLNSNAYGVPHTATLILNYKRDKWSFTPSLQFEAGQRYGSPENQLGVDPAAGCSALGALSPTDPRYTGSEPNTNGQTTASSYDATSCGSAIPVPNQYTKAFDNVGAFVAPSQLLGHLQISYEATPRVTFQLTLANLLSTCFGGTKEPWTAGASNKVCSYAGAGTVIAPVGNIYNPGATINPLAQYPYVGFPGVYNPDVNGGLMPPFNAYFDVKVKL